MLLKKDSILLNTATSTNKNNPVSDSVAPYYHQAFFSLEPWGRAKSDIPYIAIIFQSRITEQYISLVENSVRSPRSLGIRGYSLENKKKSSVGS